MKTRFYQAEVTDVSRIMDLCENFSEDMQSLNYPPVDKPTLEKFLMKWLGMGKIILAAGKDGTSQDPAHNPPKPDENGVFIEPKCMTPIVPPPDTWAWCRRTNTGK